MVRIGWPKRCTYLQAVLACRRQPGAAFEHTVNAYGLACLELGSTSMA